MALDGQILYCGRRLPGVTLWLAFILQVRLTDNCGKGSSDSFDDYLKYCIAGASRQVVFEDRLLFCWRWPLGDSWWLAVLLQVLVARWLLQLSYFGRWPPRFSCCLFIFQKIAARCLLMTYCFISKDVRTLSLDDQLFIAEVDRQMSLDDFLSVLQVPAARWLLMTNCGKTSHTRSVYNNKLCSLDNIWK